MTEENRHMDLWRLFLSLCLAMGTPASAEFFRPFNVNYDHRALIIGGQRRMLFSAGIHYPRATPEMWSGIIARSKEGGVDMVQTYVFWNGHEPVRGQYNFKGRYDLVKFAKLVGSSGLYLHLRIGPYVCAEWNFGGLPVWLRDIPGMEFRTNNEEFKKEMQRFVKKIVDLMLQEMLFSWQGGPIIILQVENEYGNVESSFGQNGKEYVKWAATMALGLNAGVPWVMCQQKDAPEGIINTCNGFYCDGFRPNSYKKPVIWTEDWNGWFASWGSRLPHRPVEDNAFAVARFFERGGCLHNYYMFFGGTNFERTSGGPLQITSYDYDAPVDEYGLLNFPKWGHLKDLHAAIKLCEPALVAVDDGPQYRMLGPLQEVHVYSSSKINFNSSLPKNIMKCSAFLANIDEYKSVNVIFLGENYVLPPWSVSILPDCKHVAFNTAKVTAQTSVKEFAFSSSISNISLSDNLVMFHEKSHLSINWMSFKEYIGLWDENSFSAEGILEHLNVTKDLSDYLWYITRVYITVEDISFWETSGTIPLLKIDKGRDVIQIFINGQLAGSTVGHWVQVEQPVHFIEGENELIILTETVGLQNYGAFLEKDGAGLRGQVKLCGLKNGELDLSKAIWTYQVGLEGELKKIYSWSDHQSVEWNYLNVDFVPSLFTWYKTFFDAPTRNGAVAINLESMGKGHAWINGHGIGRFWSRIAPKDGCPRACNYRGAYSEYKCRRNCGKPTQEWYHVPRSWLQASSNLLVIFSETGGDPFKICLKLRLTDTICSMVSENDYPPLTMWLHEDFASGNISIASVAPEMHLQCDIGQRITDITFASYGTPIGSCLSFSHGNCHAPSSLSIVSEACLGKKSCRIEVSNRIFGRDPCRHVLKTLAVEAKCTATLGLAST